MILRAIFALSLAAGIVTALAAEPDAGAGAGAGAAAKIFERSCAGCHDSALRTAARIVIALGAVAVSLAGHTGGELVYGEGYPFR